MLLGGLLRGLFAGCSRLGCGGGVVEDGRALLGALGLILGHEPFDRRAYHGRLDGALGVLLSQCGGDFGSGAGFALACKVFADEVDEGDGVAGALAVLFLAVCFRSAAAGFLSFVRSLGLVSVRVRVGGAGLVVCCVSAGE